MFLWESEEPCLSLFMLQKPPSAFVCVVDTRPRGSCGEMNSLSLRPLLSQHKSSFLSRRYHTQILPCVGVV